METTRERHILAFSGGSGSGYALRLLEHASLMPHDFHLVFSDNFFRVLEKEFKLPADFDQSASITVSKVHSLLNFLFGSKDRENNFKILPFRDIGSEAASGSASYKSMAIVPCSMKTLASISAGITTNLIERAADVSLKERRTLILVPRETPYSLIQIRNMETLTLAGATILPASPGFYHKPESFNDLYDFIVDRILQHMKLPYRKITPWQG